MPSADAQTRLFHEPRHSSQPQLRERHRQLQDTFVVSATDDEIFFLDQHVAHERVLFERLLAELDAGPLASQELLFPQPVELGAGQAALVQEWTETLEGLGFRLEGWSGSTVVLRAVPALLRGQEPRRLIEALVEDVNRPRKGEPQPLLHRALSFVACHAAIKAHARCSARRWRGSSPTWPSPRHRTLPARPPNRQPPVFARHKTGARAHVVSRAPRDCGCAT